MSDGGRSTSGSEQADAYPKSPVCRVEIEHEDGTVKELEGQEAKDWADWVDAGLSFYSVHESRSPPDVDWSVDTDTDREDVDDA